MSFSFPYRKEIFENKVRYFPKITVLLHNKGVKFETPALLDSGATDIFIPRETADALELELKNESNADGWLGKFKVYDSRVGIVVGKGSQTFRKVLPCLVPAEVNENQEVVLGRSFFQFYEVTFNERKRFTILKRTPEK